MKKKLLAAILTVIMFLLALGMTLYPLVSNWYYARHQSEIHTQYLEQMEQAEDNTLTRAKELADAYNTALVPGTADDAYSREVLLAASEDYEDLLNIAGNGIMGFVVIPKISVNLPIYHGTDTQTLAAGVGHLLGSSLPVGGSNTHAVLTAHSGMSSQKMFSDIDELKIGDLFYLEVLGETPAYQVDQIQTVLPEDTTYLQIGGDEDFCTLVTCTPFGINTHRLLVRGERVSLEMDAEDDLANMEIPEAEVAGSTWERHYLLGVGLGLCLAALMVVILLFVTRPRKKGRFEREKRA